MDIYSCRLRASVLTAAAFITLAGTLSAQSSSDPRPLDDALRFREAGDFVSAVSLLRQQLEHNPADPEATAILAETLYWLKEFAASRELFERALAARPEDDVLRLVYARTLVETTRYARAMQVLRPVDDPAARPQAEALRGKIAYWRGDLAGARKFFLRALEGQPGLAEAETQLAEIRMLTSPWLRSEPSFQHDDQPLDRLDLLAEAGWFPVVSTSLYMRSVGSRLQHGPSASHTLVTVEAGVSHDLPHVRARIRAGGGLVRRNLVGTAIVANGSLDLRLLPSTRLRVSFDRLPYLYTVASLGTSVMTNAGAAVLQFGGILGAQGEAAIQTQRYPDDNSITSAYAWALVPIVRSYAVTLRAGYSASYQNAADSRFVLRKGAQPFLPGDLRFDTSGWYSPYYTPLDLKTHSALGGMRARLSSSVLLHANASYAFTASETAVSFGVTAPDSLLQPRLIESRYTRSLNPWAARAALEHSPAAGVVLVAAVEAARTGLYRAWKASLVLSYTLLRQAAPLTEAHRQHPR